MGKVDVHESDYLENAEIFADLVNGALYLGKQVVKPEELQEQDGELRSILGENVKKTIRDKVRLWKGTVLAVLAVENQTNVDYHMVLRVILSEAMAYDKQWKKRKEELEAERKRAVKDKKVSQKEEDFEKERAVEKESLISDEFISSMRKGDKFIPVITIVVYYGQDKAWDGARTLYELLEVEGNEEEVLPFITNYRLNIFDYHEHDSFEQFHSELQSVFEFLRYSDDRKLLEEKLEEHKERYEELSNQAKVLLAQLTNIKRLPDVKEKDFKKGEFKMCKAFEDMKEEGRIEGKIEGGAKEIVEMGHEFGLTESDILGRLQNRLNISIKEAQKYFTMFEKQVV